jgi:hypothetical protein
MEMTMRKVIIKYGLTALLLSSGWISCGQGEEGDALPPEKTDPAEEEAYALPIGVYLETHPDRGSARIDVFDTERLILTEGGEGRRPYSYEYTYKINEQTIALSEKNGVAPKRELFFRAINDSVFEMQSIHPVPGYNGSPAVMTFERDKNQAVKDPAEKLYTVAAIENLQTQLRILDPEGRSRESMWHSDLNDLISHETMWRWDPKNVIIHFPPMPQYYLVDTHFGYVDADGQTILCEVINFPEAALQWEDVFHEKEGYGIRTEINVQMSGTVRLYVDLTGKKCGTLELTSLEPSETGSGKLQTGVYWETYPSVGDMRTKINIIDEETLEITYPDGYLYAPGIPLIEKFGYEIWSNTTVSEGETKRGFTLRVISDSKFETVYIHAITAENGPPMMTFEKENSSNN